MIQNLSYTEMNQAVPGSILSTRMERHLECEVPSPSQWSDSCRSPPSLHSPVHFSLELEKLKEEPYSPLSYHNLPSYTAHLMSKENSSEASINLAELLAENSALVGSIQQQQQPQYLQPKVECEQTSFENSFDFLDSLVEIKQENDDQNYVIPVVSSPPSAPFSTADSVTPSCVASKPSPQPQATTVQTNLSLGDRLRTVELMALDHWRKDVQNISNQLSIPKDPAAWSVANVRSWLEFEAEKQCLPSPPNLELYNLNGMELIGLTEAQFRKFIPRGELLYAKLEIWLEALRSSYQLEVPLRSSAEIQTGPSVYSSQPQSLTQYQSPLQFHNSPSTLQPLSVHVSYYNHPPVYQSPSSSCVPELMFSPSSSTMLSPPPPTSTSVQQLSPTQSHSQPSESPSLLPTTVIHAGRQQQLKHKISEIDSPLPTKRKRSQSPSPQIRNSFLEEACLDMSSLLQQGCGEVSKPQPSLHQQTSVADTTREIPDSGDDEVEEESPSVPSGRGGTHIHLWQFLKELLVRPQLYAPYIRWLDRQAGIFKIEDSTRVAKLWGERKNRPAMNYDKLSRSIRQYYKKGIMKKTERSQRLVYQFCHPYGS